MIVWASPVRLPTTVRPRIVYSCSGGGVCANAPLETVISRRAVKIQRRIVYRRKADRAIITPPRGRLLRVGFIIPLRLEREFMWRLRPQPHTTSAHNFVTL